MSMTMKLALSIAAAFITGAGMFWQSVQPGAALDVRLWITMFFAGAVPVATYLGGLAQRAPWESPTLPTSTVTTKEVVTDPAPRGISGRSLLIIALPLAAVLASGCTRAILTGPIVAYTAKDAQSAAMVANASKDLLPPGDVWGDCMTFLSAGIAKLKAGPGLKTPTNGLLTEAMRLHVLRSLSQNIPSAMKSACGQVFLEIMLDAGQRAPGL